MLTLTSKIHARSRKLLMSTRGNFGDMGEEILNEVGARVDLLCQKNNANYQFLEADS
jgi:hypothetical protein